MDAGQHKYQGFIFLSEDAMLFPDVENLCLELFTLTNNKLILRCSLDLPALAPGYDVTLFTCRAEPNPTGSPSKTKPRPKLNSKPTHVRVSATPPFAANPDDAIALFNLLIIQTDAWEQQFFSILIHRSSLLKFLDHLNPDSVSIPWRTWGPSTTRWLNGSNTAHGYITITAG